MKKQRKFLTPMFLLLLLTGLQYGCVGIHVQDSGNGTKTVPQSRLNKEIIGTWQMCKQDSTVNTNLFNKGFVRYKIVSDKSFINVDIKQHQRDNYNTIYGSYELRDGIYTEFVETTSSGYKHFLGVKNPFNIKIVGDLMFLEYFSDRSIEIWKKLK